FAGHGNKKESLKEIVKREQLKSVKILDFLQGKDFEDALEISTCSVVSLEKGLAGLCVPSKTYSYIEAGIPIIAIMEESDITRDIQEYQNGFVFKQGDSNALSNVLRNLAYEKEYIKHSGIDEVRR